MNSTAASAKSAWPLAFLPPVEVSFSSVKRLGECFEASALPKSIQALAALSFADETLVPLQVHAMADSVAGTYSGPKLDPTKLSLDLVSAVLKCAARMPKPQ